MIADDGAKAKTFEADAQLGRSASVFGCVFNLSRVDRSQIWSSFTISVHEDHDRGRAWIRCSDSHMD